MLRDFKRVPRVYKARFKFIYFINTAFIFAIIIGATSAFGMPCEIHLKRPLSKISREAGYVSMKHWTRFENVIEILASKKMELPKNLPTEKIRSGNNYTPDLIMFYLQKTSDPVLETPELGYTFQPAPLYLARTLFSKLQFSQKRDDLYAIDDVFFSDLDRVYLIFSLEAMDSRDFHIHKQTQAYGEYDAGVDFRSTYVTPTLEAFYNQNEIGEVGFYETIPTDLLLEVWVSPQRREELITRSKAAGITAIGGRPIETLIKSPAETHVYISIDNLPLLPEERKDLDNIGVHWLIAPKGALR